jgi:hypothetical protein
MQLSIYTFIYLRNEIMKVSKRGTEQAYIAV